MTEKDPSGKDPHEPGAKLDEGKLRADFILQFPRALKAVAEVAQHGAGKYSEGGWMHVEDGQRRYRAAQLRHQLDGAINPVDDKSGKLHAAHEAWNVLAWLELILKEQEPEHEKSTDDCQQKLLAALARCEQYET